MTNKPLFIPIVAALAVGLGCERTQEDSPLEMTELDAQDEPATPPEIPTIPPSPEVSTQEQDPDEEKSRELAKAFEKLARSGREALDAYADRLARELERVEDRLEVEPNKPSAAGEEHERRPAS